MGPASRAAPETPDPHPDRWPTVAAARSDPAKPGQEKRSGLRGLHKAKSECRLGCGLPRSLVARRFAAIAQPPMAMSRTRPKAGNTPLRRIAPTEEGAWPVHLPRRTWPIGASASRTATAACKIARAPPWMQPKEADHPEVARPALGAIRGHAGSAHDGLRTNRDLVRLVGLEPTLREERVFETPASTIPPQPHAAPFSLRPRPRQCGGPEPRSRGASPPPRQAANVAHGQRRSAPKLSQSTSLPEP